MDSNIGLADPRSGHLLRAELLADALRSGGAVCLRVFGGSMWPWLRSGDALSVRREEAARIHPGEIVLFVREGRLYAHRVIRKSWHEGRAVLVTKGDALPRADAPLAAGELLGRVFRVRRGAREFALDSPQRRTLGRAAALVTHSSRFWYPLARAVRRILPS
ncbi:MAG: S24/S26 family peptidase [Acidobacteria bacterium]|nr:S24/S26 family peptidase [Acidobacteriota bacterium]